MKRTLCIAFLAGLVACAREPAGPLEPIVDLSVDRLDASPSIPMIGEAVILKANIVNQGTEVVTDGLVSFYMDLDGDSLWSAAEVVEESVAVSVTVPGEATIAKARIDSLPLGVLSFHASLDRADDNPANSQDTLFVEEDPLRLHVIDVGQGDAILVELPGGVDILVDGGDVGAGQVVLDYLAANQIDSLDVVVATHLDQDHYGGLTTVLNSGEVVVEQLWYPCARVSGPASLEDFKEAYRGHAGLDTLVVSSGETIEGLGALVGFEVIHPLEAPADACDDDERNDQSIVCRVDFGEFSALLTGDIGADAESDLVALGAEIDVDVVKVAHHGSVGSSIQSFVDAVSASTALISVGADNDYGHPDGDVLSRWSGSGATVYRTDLDGTLVVISDGEMIRVEIGGDS